MTIKISMPALSPTMTEGSLTRWLVKEGDEIKAGDILAEIETDKATMEVESADEGTITSLIVKEGSSHIPVNTTIAILNGNEEEVDKDKIESNFKQPQPMNSSVEEKSITSNLNDNLYNNESKNLKKRDVKIIATPYVKSLAKKKSINLNSISGSGPNGRIIKKDLENKQTSKLPEEAIQENTIQLSSIRKIIAQKTTLTKQTVPHFYLTIESNVDNLLKMRKKINAISDSKISINDILVKALALAQNKNPSTNISWLEGKIIKHKSVDVSIAVALDEGLITPIVKDADYKGIIEISKEIKELTTKAKKGLLLLEDYTGGTISISNLGMYGISEFAAIINPPQSCILAVGTIKKIAGIIDNEVQPINILKSTLSVDHRVLDGAVAGKLLKDFNDIIEYPFDLWLNSSDMEII